MFLCVVISLAALAAPPKLYDGRSLEDWQSLMRELVLTDPAVEKYVPGLIEIVADREAPDLARKQAAFTLGRIGSRAAGAIPVLEEIVQRESTGGAESPRCWGAKALSYFKSHAAATAPTLVAILRDKNAPALHRQAMLDPLAAIGAAHPEVVPAMVGLLQGEDPPGVPLRELSLEVALVMGPQADALAPLLMRILRQPREAASMRRKSAAALGAMKGRAEPAATALAESVVTDADESVRDAAALALGEIGPATIPILRRLAISPDAGVRWRVAAALGRMKQAARPAIDVLQKLLADGEPIVRIAACEAWIAVALRASAAVPILAKLLAADDRGIRLRAIKQLTSLPAERAAIRTAVEPLLEDDRGAVRETAAKVLEKLDMAER